MKKFAELREALDTDIRSHSMRRLASIMNNPQHPLHSAAKAEHDRRVMARHMVAREATYSDTGWQKPSVKKDKFGNVIKTKNIAKSLAKAAAKQSASMQNETKGAPKGYHFTRDGKLKKGDAGADGDGGAMLRSDPLDKQRSKIPPIPEKFANPAQQAAVMAKLKKSGKYDGKEDTKPDAAEVIRKKQQMAAISTSDKDKLSKIRSMMKRANEGLEQDGPRKPNTPDGLSKNFGKMYGKKASAYLTKKVDDRQAAHAKQDPGMVKKGYGPAVVDREKAQAKRAKRYKKLGKI